MRHVKLYKKPIFCKVSGSYMNILLSALTSHRIEKKRKITPVHSTGMNMSPLTESLTHFTGLSFKDLCLLSHRI